MRLPMPPTALSSPRRLKSTPKALFQFWRWLSSPDVSQLLPTQNPSPSSESMFGLGPRKRVEQNDPEREDFVGSSSQPQTLESSQNAEQVNYFSKAWADQRTIRERRGPVFGERQQPTKKVPSIFRTEPGLSVDLPMRNAPRPEGQDRAWMYASDMPSSTQERFVIASYNILASTYARQFKGYLYAHVPSQALNWNNRKRQIIFELGLCSPDIICLQEVDRFSDLKADLGMKGYDALYKVRTGGAPDGCAICWRRDRFRLLHEESIEFSGLEMRDNVAQLCVLQLTVPGTQNDGSISGSRVAGHGESSILVVGNINVLFNPKRGDIKLGQCRTFLEQAHIMSSSWNGAPVVIGGCFNITPSSALYDFLAKSELDVSGMDRRYLSGQTTSAARSAATNSSFNGATKSGDAIENMPPFSTSSLGIEVSENKHNIENFKETLQLSMKARFASKQKKYATEFASAATEALDVCNRESLDGKKTFSQGNQCSSTVNRWSKEQIIDEQELVKKDQGDDAFLSRTIKFLEGSLGSPISRQKGSQNESLTSEIVQEDEVDSGVSSSIVGSSVGVNFGIKTGIVQAGTCSASHKTFHDSQENPLKSDLFLSPAAEVGVEGSAETRVESSKQGAVMGSVQAALSEILEATQESPTHSGKSCIKKNANSVAEYLLSVGVGNTNANYEGGSEKPDPSLPKHPSHHMDHQLTRSAIKINGNSLEANLDTGSTEGHSVDAEEQTRKFELSHANPISLGTSEEVSSASELISPSIFTSPGSREVNNVVSPKRLHSIQSDSTPSSCKNFVLGMPENISEVKRDNDTDNEEEHQWDLEELKTATGDPDCTIVCHKLNLHSVYSEIPGRTGTRDAKGEPLVTRYQTKFRGCVDYIWRTDGLKPVKVLDTVPLDSLRLNRGFPSEALGSDHLVMACELAFSPSKTELGNNKLEPGT